jgi:thiamine pyrophosphokinase
MTIWFLDAERSPVLRIQHDQATVSFFALFGQATVTIRGVAYPLEDHTLTPLSSLGLSNVTTADETTISVARGTLAVVHPFMPAAGSADMIDVMGTD